MKKDRTRFGKKDKRDNASYWAEQKVLPGKSLTVDVFKKAVPMLVLIILGFVIYSNTLKSPFLFDDRAHIQENPRIRITELTLKNIAAAAFKSVSPTRPVANISFALNYYFSRYDVTAYHLTNIIIHIFASVFLYLFVKNTFRTPALRGHSHSGWIAFAAAIIWLIHPLQTQSVNYIVQRMNSLGAMFYILSVLLYVKARLANRERRRSWHFYAGCAVATLLAFGSKEMTATLPFFILLYEWYFFQNLSARWLRRYLPYVLAVFVLLIFVGLWYLGTSPVQNILSYYNRRDFTLTERLLTEPRVVIYYISLLIYPNPTRLNLDHDFAISRSLLSPPTTLLCISLIIVLIGLAFYIAKKRRLLSFCILWFFGNLFIESSFIGLEIIFEHRLYLPSMLVSTALAVSAWKWIKPGKVAISVLTVIALLFCVWTYQRNKVWADPVTLWKDCAAKSPQKPRANYNLANALRTQGKIDDAIGYYNRTLALDPNRADAHIGLARSYFDLEDIEKSLAHSNQALEIDPNCADAYYNIGVILSGQEKIDKAIEYYNQALRIKPWFPEPCNNIAVSFYKQGKIKEAINYWIKALRLKPDWPEVLNNLATAFNQQGNIEKAVECWGKSLKLEPDQPGPLNNLAWIKATHKDSSFGESGSAVWLAKRACELTNNSRPGYLDTLAAAYAAHGKFAEAIQTAQDAVKLALANGNKDLAEQIQTHLNLYKSKKRITNE